MVYVTIVTPDAEGDATDFSPRSRNEKLGSGNNLMALTLGSDHDLPSELFPPEIRVAHGKQRI